MKKLSTWLVSILIIIFGIIIAMGNTSIFGYRTLQVATGSMEPDIKVGEMVIIKKSDQYEVGDIITYEIEESYVTHRIIEKNDEKIITKGDANTAIDDPITESSIIGKVIWVISNNVILYVKAGIALMIVILLFPFFKKEEK